MVVFVTIDCTSLRIDEESDGVVDIAGVGEDSACSACLFELKYVDDEGVVDDARRDPDAADVEVLLLAKMVEVMVP